MLALTEISRQLAANAQAIRALTESVSPEQARWKPAPQTWSLLEVMHHLVDEEREDFRGHLVDLWTHPEQPWRPIAPERWVTERQYNQQDFALIRENFLHERAESLDWLSQQAGMDEQAAYTLEWGRLSAGDLLVSWVAHDLLSIRHLTELNYQFLAQSAQPHQVGYAGPW